MIRRAIKERLHPRNRFRGGYDFPALVERSPGLAAFVGPNAHGDQSINYADPLAVKALNQALLAYAYGLDAWDVPPGYLCPPIPGRSDYLHHAADLLRGAAAEIPRGPAVSVFDIGMGANAIYPLIGASEYGWRFVGAEIDPAALGWAQAMVAAHPAVSALIECRLQTSPRAYFAGVVKPGEVFDLSICNPPFHASADEAAESTRRKRRHLGAARQTMSIKNFSGTDGELWCDGGELAFVQRMIAESAGMPRLCRWFTTLVSKNAHLPRFQAALRAAGAADVRTIDMTHGQKQSRLLGWSFMWHKSSHMSIKPIIIV